MRTWYPLHRSLMLFAASFLFSCIAVGQEGSINSAAGLNEYLTGMVKSQNFVCLGAAFIKNNEIVWQNCYGYSDLENQKPLKIDDIYQLASLSKTVTATA